MKKRRYDYQATFERIGAEIPLRRDGWEFRGSAVLDGDNGPFLLARWRRRL